MLLTLLRKAFKKTCWPQFYWAQIPIKSKKDNKKHTQWHPFILPHEWMATFFPDPDRECLQKCQPEKGSKAAAAMASMKEKLGLEELVIPFAPHGDGAPVQGTIRQEGLGFLTVNLPGAHDAKIKSPVPFTLLQSCFYWEYETKETILHILMWSMTCLKNGKFPTTRHDGTAWLKSEKERAKKAGKTVPAKGILVEMGLAQQLVQHTHLQRQEWHVLAVPCNIREFELALPMTEVLD